nr:hypothetical protein [Tanacetum cinerariifolium]
MDQPDSPEAAPQSPIQTPPVPPDEDEREPMFIQPHDPDYFPKPMYPEYIPLEDEHVLPAEEQPLPPVVSPTAELPEYVAESDPEEDLEEYEDDESEDGPIDYPMDGGNDGDDDDGDSSGDDADDEDEEEEEEHLALTNSGVVVVERLLAMPTPLPSPLTSLSPPIAAEHLARCTTLSAHSSPSPVPSLLLPSSGCPTQIQTLRMASTQALINAITAVLPSPPLPPPLYIPPPVDRRDDIPKTKMLPHKRSCLFALGSKYEIGESSTARPTEGQGIDYGDTWVNPTEAVPEITPMTLREVNTRVIELAELHEHDTHDLYALLEDAHDSRTRISQRVYAHEFQLQAHQMQQQLQGTLIQTQHQMVEILRVMGDMRREMGDMQAELLALREQPKRARQPGSDARVPDHKDASRDADSHI